MSPKLPILLCSLFVAPPAEAWETAVLKTLVPGATLSILGGGPSRQEQVTVSCVVDNQSGAIRRFFVDVNFKASPSPDVAGISFATSRATTDFVADYAPAPNLTPKVTAHGEQVPGRSRMFSWLEDLLKGGPLAVEVTVGKAVVSSFTVAGDQDASAVQNFLAQCPNG